MAIGFKAEIKIIRSLEILGKSSLLRIANHTKYSEKTCKLVLHMFLTQKYVKKEDDLYSLTKEGGNYLVRVRRGEMLERRVAEFERKSVSPIERKLMKL
ncbi:MAG: hypothetical protein ACYCPW_04665 [Nitrososphaerales archaeon]